MNEKEKFVIEWLEKEQFVDVLCQDFMEQFANRFNCKGRRMSIGAPRVPLAGRTLSAMFKKGLLARFTVGIDAYAGGIGFPKWVYSYSLAKPEMQAIILLDVVQTEKPATRPESKYGVAG